MKVFAHLTPEKIARIKSGMTPDNSYTDDLGYCQETWGGVDGSCTLRCLIEYPNAPEYSMVKYFGINIKDLRTTDFLRTCLIDEDVNHALYMDKIPENLDELVAFVKGETNRLPVTPCGLENYLN